MRKRRILSMTLALFIAPMFCSVGSAQDIAEVVHATWIAGVPYSEAKKFDSNDCDYLLEMIEREEEAPYWPHATKVLGIIGGGDRIYGPLVALIEGSNDDFSKTSAVYSGRLSAVLALGHLANHDNDGYDEAMVYLTNHTKPSDWWGRHLRWVEDYEDAVNLSIWTVHALSISGREQVPEILMGLLVASSVPDRTKHAAKSALVNIAASR